MRGNDLNFILVSNINFYRQKVNTLDLRAKSN